MPQVQDQSLKLLTCSPTTIVLRLDPTPQNLGEGRAYSTLLCIPLQLGYITGKSYITTGKYQDETFYITTLNQILRTEPHRVF